MGGEKATDLVKDTVGMVQDLMVGQTKDDEASGRKPGIATAVAQASMNGHGQPKRIFVRRAG